MTDDQDFFDKAGEYLTHIGNVIGREDFQNHLERAGSIAALIGLGIRLYKDVKEKAQSKDERAFNSLIKAAFVGSVNITISLPWFICTTFSAFIVNELTYTGIR